VAIHHASVLTDSPEGRRIATNSRDRFLNEGIRLSAIALWLDTAEADTPEHRGHVERLRALSAASTPAPGSSGRSGGGRAGGPANEVVADSYRGRVEVLDLGYWDMSALADAPGGLRSLAADVGRVVAEMGLDVWCLTHADAVDLDAICEQLWASYELRYQAIPIGPLPPAGPASGFLIRPSKTLLAVPLAAEPGQLPARLKLRARSRKGDAAEFVLVPLIRGPSQGPGLSALEQSVRRHDAVQGPDWIFVGDDDLVLVPEELSLLAESGDIVMAAANPRDGAVVLISGPASMISQVFVSENLQPTLDLTGAMTRSTTSPEQSVDTVNEVARTGYDRVITYSVRAPILVEAPVAPRLGSFHHDRHGRGHRTSARKRSSALQRRPFRAAKSSSANAASQRSRVHSGFWRFSSGNVSPR